MWQGACVGRGVCMVGACMAGDTATAADGNAPYWNAFLLFIKLNDFKKKLREFYTEVEAISSKQSFEYDCESTVLQPSVSRPVVFEGPLISPNHHMYDEIGIFPLVFPDNTAGRPAAPPGAANIGKKND